MRKLRACATRATCRFSCWWFAATWNLGSRSASTSRRSRGRSTDPAAPHRRSQVAVSSVQLVESRIRRLTSSSRFWRRSTLHSEPVGAAWCKKCQSIGLRSLMRQVQFGGSMSIGVSGAFKEFQGVVNADAERVREARRRRDLFKGAFLAESDVAEVVASGSLARGTQKDPIHDVDAIVIFDGDKHPGWGIPGGSASEALDYTRDQVNKLLGATNGTYAQVVRLARWRNHAVKCFLDDPDDPDAFTVDAMPALRREGSLLIPEAIGRKWVRCDPESLHRRRKEEACVLEQVRGDSQDAQVVG